METRSKVAQLYGYAVCLVCVITLLISSNALIGAIFELSDPLHSHTPNNAHEPSLASYDNYKMDVTRATREGKESVHSVFSPDDNTLRAMYDAAKSDRIQTVKLQAYRTITVGGLMIGLFVLLFATHWMWVRRLTNKVAGQIPQDSFAAAL